MNQLDCVISYFFQLHLIFHACIQNFDVTDTVRNFLTTKQAYIPQACDASPVQLQSRCSWWATPT
jgi:hypothetical protein